MFLIPLSQFGNISMQFIIQDQYQTGSDSSKDIGRGSLKERLHSSFILINLSKAVKSTSIQNISSSTLHHHSPSDSIQRITHNSWQSSHKLSKNKFANQRCFSIIFPQQFLSSIITSEITSSISKYSQHWNIESLI